MLLMLTIFLKKYGRYYALMTRIILNKLSNILKLPQESIYGGLKESGAVMLSQRCQGLQLVKI